MKFENIGLEKLQLDLSRLEFIMSSRGLIRADQWDFERVTFDRKFELKEGIYYLRVFGFATQGDIGAEDATIELMTPLLGKHYYPHGVEYGEAEHFPASLVETCEKLLTEIKNEIDNYLV